MGLAKRQRVCNNNNDFGGPVTHSLLSDSHMSVFAPATTRPDRKCGAVRGPLRRQLPRFTSTVEPSSLNKRFLVAQSAFSCSTKDQTGRGSTTEVETSRGGG